MSEVKSYELLMFNKVMKSTRSIRTAFGVLGAMGGTVVGYTSATAGFAGLFVSTPFVIGSAASGAFLYGVYLYGAGTLGTELAGMWHAKKYQLVPASGSAHEADVVPLMQVERVLRKPSLFQKVAGITMLRKKYIRSVPA